MPGHFRKLSTQGKQLITEPFKVFIPLIVERLAEILLKFSFTFMQFGCFAVQLRPMRAFQHLGPFTLRI